MELKETYKLKDERTGCYSLLCELSVKDYLALIEKAYRDKGGIAQQREPLKTSSAIRIRKRMVEDIKQSSVLPPIVVGVIVDEEKFESISHIALKDFCKIVEVVPDGDLSIIDGMQRTTALFEAVNSGFEPKSNLRVEFWVATKLNSLIYRMLVLNTGQVPWNLRRQIETVFSSMINEIKGKIPGIEVFTIQENARRTQGGQYHANDIIELYLTFGGRKEKVDTKERLADEFTRLEFIEVTEDSEFADTFYETIEYLGLIDKEFTRYKSETHDNRFSDGQDLFKSQPARVGFVTAIAKKVLGRPGVEKDHAQKSIDRKEILEQLVSFNKKLKEMNSEEIGSFLALQLLSEKLSVKSSRVGDFEREFFTKAFDTLIDEKFQLKTLEVCWLAY